MSSTNVSKDQCRKKRRRRRQSSVLKQSNHSSAGRSVRSVCSVNASLDTYTNENHILFLPYEVITVVCKELDPKSFCSLARSCRELYDLLMSQTVFDVCSVHGKWYKIFKTYPHTGFDTIKRIRTREQFLRAHESCVRHKRERSGQLKQRQALFSHHHKLEREVEAEKEREHGTRRCQCQIGLIYYYFFFMLVINAFIVGWIDPLDIEVIHFLPSFLFTGIILLGICIMCFDYTSGICERVTDAIAQDNDNMRKVDSCEVCMVLGTCVWLISMVVAGVFIPYAVLEFGGLDDASFLLYFTISSIVVCCMSVVVCVCAYYTATAYTRDHNLC